MPSKLYIANETALLINGESGADYAWSMEGVTNTAGRVSAQIDLGAVSRAFLITWSCEVQAQATPTAGATLDLYKGGAPDGDATQIDGDTGNADAALTAEMEKNMQYFGSVVSENATASEKCVSSGSFVHYQRYLSLAAINNLGATINATDTNFRFDLQAKALEGQ